MSLSHKDILRMEHELKEDIDYCLFEYLVNGGAIPREYRQFIDEKTVAFLTDIVIKIVIGEITILNDD